MSVRRTPCRPAEYAELEEALHEFRTTRITLALTAAVAVTLPAGVAPQVRPFIPPWVIRSPLARSPQSAAATFRVRERVGQRHWSISVALQPRRARLDKPGSAERARHEIRVPPVGVRVERRDVQHRRQRPVSREEPLQGSDVRWGHQRGLPRGGRSGRGKQLGRDPDAVLKLRKSRPTVIRT